jgi:hypothetical protein
MLAAEEIRRAQVQKLWATRVSPVSRGRVSPARVGVVSVGAGQGPAMAPRVDEHLVGSGGGEAGA